MTGFFHEVKKMKTYKFRDPLYRDPVYDGASDPTVIRNKEDGLWYMFYTQRRIASPEVGYSQVHGSKIGIAVSEDLQRWLYRGTAEIEPVEPGHNTYWAPEVFRTDGIWHMFVSYVTGIPTDWEWPRRILHYTSGNLWNWKYEETCDLGSDRVIDACVLQMDPETSEEGTDPGRKARFRMWYKDERHGSHIFAADSMDLHTWRKVGEALGEAQEGPYVFRFRGKTYMITDGWEGLSVYQSDDLLHWSRQKHKLIGGQGYLTYGHHASICMLKETGEDGPGRNVPVLFFFTGLRREEQGDGLCRTPTAVQAAELEVRDGQLTEA